MKKLRGILDASDKRKTATSWYRLTFTAKLPTLHPVFVILVCRGEIFTVFMIHNAGRSLRRPSLFCGCKAGDPCCFQPLAKRFELCHCENLSKKMNNSC